MDYELDRSGQLMNKRQRIWAAIQGEAVDRVPIALWRHFPYVDQTAEGLAKAVVDFQLQFDFDLVKVTPTSGYPAEAWGAELVHADNSNGTRNYVRRPVQQPADWRRLPVLTVTHGVLGRELQALKLIRQGVGSEVHVLQTIFSPLTIARNLAGEVVFTHLHEHPADLHAGLEVITEVTGAFAYASLEAGADGIFFATQLAAQDKLPEADYRRFGLVYDRQVLDRVARRADVIVLHLHGLGIYFDLVTEYPAQIVNWHDRLTSPALGTGKERAQGAVLGGLDEWAVLRNGQPEDVAAQVADAIAQTGGRRVIIGAGCVTPVDTPVGNIRAAREAVEH